MNLLEHQAKAILAKSSIPIPRGEVITPDTIGQVRAPVVLKSQVPIGGRGKLGGVIIVQQQSQVKTVIKQLFNQPIRGYLPQSLLAEEVLSIKRELYISLNINRDLATIELLAHQAGGIEVEEQTTAVFRKNITESTIDSIAIKLAEYFDLTEQLPALHKLLKNLLSCFVANDCLMLEINPLVITPTGNFVAGDAKITLDDAAMFRHPEWPVDQTADHNFVLLNHEGTIATIANGAGLAMATVDAVVTAGYTPANFLDIGGNTTPQKILACFNQIIELPKIETVIINIFGGIVRCDDVAQAILDAQHQFPHLPQLAIRLTGNRANEAKQLLATANLPLFTTLNEALESLS